MARYSTSNGYPVKVGLGYRSGVWDFTRDGVVIGRITETTDGYVGVLYGPNGPKGVPAFTGCELPFRQSVIDQLTKQADRLLTSKEK
jgi:hypothetical protein